MISRFARLIALASLLSAMGPALSAQTAPTSGVRPNRLVIRNAMVVSGNGTPASGPYDIVVNGAVVHGGGIEWTIKDGIPYHVPELMGDVKAIVLAARAARK